ncbi:DUF2752 domain-containing protein [Planctomycetota bacterium]|nr:DUF2752 domain-containing protein [Planctomycetota bacterium]
MSEHEETKREGEGREHHEAMPVAVNASDDHRRVHPHTVANYDDKEEVRRNRMVALILLSVCLFPLLMGLYLTPEGGLSKSFGVPACGFKLETGLPCLTCGMTTSVTHAVRGDLLTAFWLQPFGAMLAVGAAAFSFVFGWSLYTGMSLEPIGRVIWRPRVIIPLAVLLVLSWVYNLVMTMMGYHA